MHPIRPDSLQRRKTLPILALVVVMQLHQVALGDTTPRNPTEQEVRELFECLTKPVPLRLRLEAELEIIEPSWTDDQINKELTKQEKIMRQTDQNHSRKDRELLRKARLEAIRNSHSGRKQMKVREWLSGKLYRLDQTDLSTLASDATLASKITSGAIPFHMTFVNIDDPAFTNIAGFRANHSLESATIDTPKHGRHELWQALTIEPQLAVTFLIVLLDTNSLSAPKMNPVDSSFAGLRMDPQKLDALVKQRIPHWSVTVRETLVGANLTKCLLMKGLPKSPIEEIEFAFYSDLRNPDHLLKVEALRSKLRTRYTSIREQFDTNSFPRRWRTESVDEKGIQTTKAVTFTEVDLLPDFDDHAVFAPHFPTNYIVAANTAQGRRIVQHPDPRAKILDNRPKWQSRSTVFVIAILLLLIAPLAFIRRKAR